MITTGAICISEVLGKCSLKDLNMSLNNNIGDFGISVVAAALSNSQISKLDVGRCGITLIGAKLLAEGLQVNNSIRILCVWGNPITMEGARLILLSAVYNGVCQEVKVDNDYINDEVKMMMTILEQRKIQEVGGCVMWRNDNCHGIQESDEYDDVDQLVVQEEITGRRLCRVM